MVNQEEIMLEILSKLNKMESRLDKIEGREDLSKTDNKAVFYSSKDPIEQIGEAELRTKEKLDPKLDKATDMIIEHFSKYPPIEGGNKRSR
jgi:hypothetical protein